MKHTGFYHTPLLNIVYVKYIFLKLFFLWLRTQTVLKRRTNVGSNSFVQVVLSGFSQSGSVNDTRSTSIPEPECRILQDAYCHGCRVSGGWLPTTCERLPLIGPYFRSQTSCRVSVYVQILRQRGIWRVLYIDMCNG